MSASDNIVQLFERARTVGGVERGEIGHWILAESKTLESFEPLLPYLGDKMWQLRAYAVEALGNFEEPEVARHLIEQFEKETEEDEEQVQVEIVISLRYPKTLLALQALIEYAKDRGLTDWVRGEAIQSIAVSTSRIIFDSLFDLINPDEWELVDGIFDTFKFLEESEYGIAGKLTTLLKSGKLPDAFLSGGIIYLGQRRFKAASDAIVPFLDDATYRGEAARALGDIGESRVLPKLMSMRDDPDPMVRDDVAYAIKQLQVK